MIRSFIRFLIHLIVWTFVLALVLGVMLARHFFRLMSDITHEILK